MVVLWYIEHSCDGIAVYSTHMTDDITRYSTHIYDITGYSSTLMASIDF